MMDQCEHQCLETVTMKYLALVVALAAAVNGRPEGFSLNINPLAGFTGGDQPCYTTQSNGKDGGFCIQQSCCSGGLVISNLCPDYGSSVKCCYSDNSCSTACADGSTCDAAARTLACEILAAQEAGKVRLKDNHFSAAGNNPYDGASALSNIRDTCYGRKAKRSSYCDADGCAPGGCVCLQVKMLTALRDYINQFYNTHRLPLEVNALAGSSHTVNSYHYTGRTFDVPCTTPVNHCTTLRDFCLARSPVEACYPNGPCSGHATWVHCAL